MNAVVKEAMEMMEEEKYIPDLEVGEICEMNDVWDGDGDVPEDSYSYEVTGSSWINYVFEVVEEKENDLDTLVKIVNIEML